MEIGLEPLGGEVLPSADSAGDVDICSVGLRILRSMLVARLVDKVEMELVNRGEICQG